MEGKSIEEISENYKLNKNHVASFEESVKDKFKTNQVVIDSSDIKEKPE